MPICNNCQEAVYEMDPNLFTQLTREETVETMNTVAMEIGMEISDHLCETVEDPGQAEPCDCSCHPGKAAMRPRHTYHPTG